MRFCGVSVFVLFFGCLFVEAGLEFKHRCEGQTNGDDEANADESGAGDGEVTGEVHLLTPIYEVSLEIGGGWQRVGALRVQYIRSSKAC